MSRKFKARSLILSFENHEGLNPDGEVDIVKTEIDVEEKKGPGNTARLAAMFGNVSIGHAKQRSDSSSSSDSDKETKRVTKVTRVTRRRNSSSESDGAFTKVTRTTVITRSGSRSDSDNEAVVTRKGKINLDAPENRRSTFVIKAASVERYSSDEEVEVKRPSRVQKRDSSGERTVRRDVTVVKKTTKVVKRDSSDERQVKVVKKASRVARRDSSSDSGSREIVTVIKAKKVELRDSSDERRSRKEITKVSKVVQRESNDERKPKKEVIIIKKTAAVKRADSSEERRAVKDIKRIPKKINRKDSSDDEQIKQVKVVKKTSRTVQHDTSESDSDDERRHKRTVKKVTMKVHVQSSTSEDEAKTKKVVKVTKVTKASHHANDSDDERVVAKEAKKLKKVEKEIESDSDDNRSHRKEVKIIKKNVDRDRDSDDERVRKEVKVTKVTKVVKVGTSDSDSIDEGTRHIVKKVEVKRLEVDKLPLRNKNVLVVFAHVFKESYEGALVGAAVKALKEQGADVQISNLFEMGFNPVASPKDFGGFVDDQEFYSYSLLAGQAKVHGKLAQDVVAEQDKVEWADMILIVSQLQSHGLPALLKGWFDRIMTYNFAFSDGHMYEKGRLRGKKALLCLTSEALSSMYTPRGIHGDINVYLWPILNGLFRFAGFDVLKPQVYFGVGRASSGYRETVINSFNSRVHGIWDEKPLPFIGVDKFHEKRGYMLTDRSIEELSKAKRLTTGQYAGDARVSMAIVVEPEKRREAAEKSSKEKLRGSGAESKKPWHTLW